jgi:hypothetical protein
VTGVPIAPVLGPFGRNQLFSRDTRGHLDPSEGAKVDLESMSETVTVTTLHLIIPRMSRRSLLVSQ